MEASQDRGRNIQNLDLELVKSSYNPLLKTVRPSAVWSACQHNAIIIYLCFIEVSHQQWFVRNRSFIDKASYFI